MKTVFDVVDLLQLQEIWVRSPIAQAYARLERRQPVLSCPLEFRLMWLMPRLGQLRNSAAWQTNQLEKRSDPAQVPLCAMTDAYLEVLFPDISAAETRRQLFMSVYNHFVVTQFQGEQEQTCGLLRALADVRSAEAGDYLNGSNQPLEGSNFWIPVDLTDEIRSLDSRYDSASIDTPAAYVISEAFWPLLVKSTSEEIGHAAAKYMTSAIGDTNPVYTERCAAELWHLVELARDWNRSSSVVGLYYQIDDETEKD